MAGGYKYFEAIEKNAALLGLLTLVMNLGIETWAARQSPADKLARLESLRSAGARVVVVGDGVNDAPVLAGADVAVAVGSAADAAQAASDIVITGHLGALADTRALAREMLSILRQNRHWALAYNLAAVPLAALGFVPPWLAALGMKERIDGVFCVTDLLALGFLDAARFECGRRVPEDLSVIGFDDVPQAAWSAYHLTTFRQPVDDLASAVLRAIRRREAGVPTRSHLETVPIDLVVRSTVRKLSREQAA